MDKREEKKQAILNTLPMFTGTENYHRTLMPFIVYTDGVIFLCESADPFWLTDRIAITLAYRGHHWEDHGFITVKLTVKDGVGVLVYTDGNGNELLRDGIDYTDFPLDEITLWAEYAGYADQNIRWVIMLPSEH